MTMMAVLATQWSLDVGLHRGHQGGAARPVESESGAARSTGVVQFLTYGLVVNAILIALALYIVKETYDYAFEKRWPNVVFGVIAILLITAVVLWRLGLM